MGLHGAHTQDKNVIWRGKVRLHSFFCFTMGPPILVQDIIDTIIDSVDGDDLDTFRQCSLVATNWVHRSQSNIFKTIEWRDQVYDDPFSKWLQFVGPRRDKLLSHTLYLLLFDLRFAEGQHLLLCKFPRLQAFQNTTQLPLLDDQFLTFMCFNMGSSLRMLILHETCIRRRTLIGVICAFPLLDYLYLHGIHTPDLTARLFFRRSPRRSLGSCLCATTANICRP